MAINRGLAVVVVGSVVAALSGCGGSEAEDATTGAKSSSANKPETLKFVQTAISPTNPELFVAEELGLFSKRRLTVEISAVGANYSTLMVSGQADITKGGIQVPVLLQSKGKDAVVLEGASGGGTGGTLLGSPKTARTLEQLASLEKCRIGTFAKGSNGWGYVNIYQEKIGSKCDRVPFSDNAATIAAFLGGRLDAMVNAPSLVQHLVDDGKATMLIDTRDRSQFSQYVPEPFLESGYWGLRSNLESKRAAVSRFLAAIDEARAWIASHSDAEVADQLVAYGDAFKSMKRSLVVDAISDSRAFTNVGNDQGKISSEQWNAAVDGLHAISAAPVGSDDPAAAYNKVVVDFRK